MIVFGSSLSFYLSTENEYFVWNYSLNPRNFLLNKIKTALLYSSALAIPIVVLLSFYFYNYLVICLDAEEVTIDYKEQEVYRCLNSQNIDLGNIEFHIIVQNRCFDTWCLGNKGIYPLETEISPLLDYTNYYDVSMNCPEIMGKLNFNTHAQFHKDYLKELFKINNLKHYKIPNEVIKEEYLEQLIARVQNETEHLPTFQTFIQFCNMIKTKLL
jgi:hypothetical protein